MSTPSNAIAVYAGQRLLGHYAPHDGKWRAWNVDGLLLGIAPDREAARKLVTQAAILRGARAE